ncbi:hypothetical protein [Micromonospora craniellae]|uniref:hypothetical protein n=1 Tax=Micromonospora craniellae TaxID=2294034 RepID=UPI0011C0F5AC|nr:hypothetical protein [Micromonospora craniellae]QOC89718.1 hypothetical protein ID554_15705 [Micromonospora craniellae]
MFQHLSSYLLLKREAARDEGAEHARQTVRAERRRQQAAAVACWYEERVLSGEPGDDDYERDYGAKLLNSSSLPIYDVHLRWARKKTADSELEDRWRNVLLYPVWYDVLPPTPDPIFVKFSDHNGIADSNLDYGLGRIAVQMSFIDSAGARWMRHVDGRLEEDPGNSIKREPAGWELLEMADVREMIPHYFQ